MPCFLPAATKYMKIGYQQVNSKIKNITFLLMQVLIFVLRADCLSSLLMYDFFYIFMIEKINILLVSFVHQLHI